MKLNDFIQSYMIHRAHLASSYQQDLQNAEAAAAYIARSGYAFDDTASPDGDKQSKENITSQ